MSKSFPRELRNDVVRVGRVSLPRHRVSPRASKGARVGAKAMDGEWSRDFSEELQSCVAPSR